MSEINTPDTAPSAPAGLLQNRKVRIALAVTAVAGVAFVAYKLKASPSVDEAVEAAASAA